MSSGLFFIIEEEKGVKYNNIDIDEAKLSYFKIHNLSYHKKPTMNVRKKAPGETNIMMKIMNKQVRFEIVDI